MISRTKVWIAILGLIVVIIVVGYLHLLKKSVGYAEDAHKYYAERVPTYNGNCLNDKCDAFCNAYLGAVLAEHYGQTISWLFIHIHQRIHRPLHYDITGKDLDICYWVR